MPRSPIRVACLLAALAGSALPLDAQVPRPDATHAPADAAWADTVIGDTIPVVFTASGGISLGAYQAGVTWALVGFMRAANASPAYRRAHKLPAFRLAVTTGASAGNVNALISAIEWCESARRAPEESLFWKTWVNVGWQQLFPDSGRDETENGVFDRSFFKTTLYPYIEDRLREAGASPACDGLPLGITLTRVVPKRFELTPQIGALTQRYATVMQVRVDPRDGALSFRQPDAELRSHALGALIAPYVPESNLVDSRTLFALIEASSAYPIAFGPRMLTYYDAELLDANGFCRRNLEAPPRCVAPDSASFTDGGVFDNNPLGLALDLYSVRRRLRSQLTTADGDAPAAPRDSLARAIFIDPDLLRQQRERAQIPVERAYGGIEAMIKLLQGFVPSAREYELQQLARTMAAGEPRHDAYISVTDRYMPIMGEHLAAFGAFLGRPLREYDFYAGVYDGLQFVARGLLCSSARGEASARCEGAALDTLLQQRTFMPLGGMAPYVMSSMLTREYRGRYLVTAPDAPAGAADSVTEHLRVLEIIESANVDGRDGPQPTCTGAEWPIALLCADGLEPVLARIAASEARPIVRRWARASQCATGADRRKEYLDRPCLANATFRDLLDDRREFVRRKVWQLLDQLRRTEESRRSHPRRTLYGDEQLSDYSELVELAHFTFLSAFDGPAKRGLDLSASTIPKYEPNRRYHLLGLLPNHVTATVFVNGLEAGWRPMYHLSRTLAVAAPLYVDDYHFSKAAGSRSNFFVGAGPAVVWKTGGMLLNDVQLGVRYLAPLHAPDIERYGAWASAELATYMVGGKLRVALFSVPLPLRQLQVHQNWRSHIGLSLGVADVPGIVYWIAR